MFITRMIDEKRRYRQYRARVEKLPSSYRTAIDAFGRYLMYFGTSKGEELLVMLEDLADLFEESAANDTPIRAIVGDDPVEFAEAFRRNYPVGQWIFREQERLTSAIDTSVKEERIS
jgi:DNA-binding ferritin-like protein (Dps family)